MEILDENVAMLSNFEVYDLLLKSQRKSKGKKPNGGSQNLATITYETAEYLSKMPCAQQSPKVIEQFLKALTSYKLTKAEKLQLLNLRPISPVEIQLVIEEIEERFTEEEITKLLDLVATILPDPAAEEDMDTTASTSMRPSDIAPRTSEHEQ